ncbi:MAG: pitrilysin family protein [Alphaproteobacteria bacterium]
MNPAAPNRHPRPMIHTLLVILTLILYTTPALAADKLLNIQEVTSAKGIKAWLVEDHSVPVIAMEFGFRGAGSKLEPVEKQGLARMLSNTMDEGAGDLDSQSFQKELKDLSIGLSFSAGRDDFTGSLKTTTENKTRAFDLLMLALSKPRFDEEPVGRMRAANQSRIRSSLSDPDWIAARIMNDAAFHGHAYAQNSGGTLTSLDKITPADLREAHGKTIGKNNVVVAVAGDMTKDELSAALDTIFGALPEIPLPPEPENIALQNQGKIFVFKKDIPQAIIETTQPGISRNDPNYHAAQMMNFIYGSSGFGSRLTSEIREKRGLTYGIYSGFTSMHHFDGLQVSTATENKNAGEIISLVNAEQEKMKSAPVTEQEIRDAKSYLIGSLPLGLTTTGDIAGLLLSLQLDALPIDYLERREDAIEKTTAADIQKLAQKLLNPTKTVTVIIGNPEKIDKTAIIVEKLPNAE